LSFRCGKDNAQIRRCGGVHSRFPSGIARDFGGSVHDPLQLSAICFSESAAPQQPEQFVPAGTSLALNLRDGFAMALNLDGFPAASNPI